MSQALLAGSAAAAFAAGLVAFFAPCCAGVMVPTYLAAVGRGSRWRVARSTALYVAGVAAVVWPITLGAGALSALISRWHPVLFVVAGFMMIGIAVALSAATGSWLGGGLLGGVYILGLVAPLLPLAFAWGQLRGRVRDPRLTLCLAGYAKRLTLSRLVGSVVFAGFGVLFISLALTGNAETAPGFQRSLGLWVGRLTRDLDSVPNAVAWPLVATLVVLLAYLVFRPAKPKEKAS